jgi:membrane dipeptidase
MLACAEKGGVIGLTAWALTATVKKGVRPTLENFMDMIDYDVKLVGIDHVAFGLDLTPNWEHDREDYEKWAKMYPSLAPARYEDRLVARGYSDADIQKILGGNLLELYRKVWRP